MVITNYLDLYQLLAGVVVLGPGKVPVVGLIKKNKLLIHKFDLAEDTGR